MAKRTLRMKGSVRSSKSTSKQRNSKAYDLYELMTSRNIGAITQKEQEKLSDSKVFVVGCGGLGGIVADVLARSGVGEISIMDGDVFEISNLNRQIFSSYSVLSKSKPSIIEKRLKDINPSIKVNSHKMFLDNEETANKLFKNHDLVIDGLDNVLSRIHVSRAAKDRKIPYVFGAAERTRGYSTVFLPKEQSYESVFMLPSNGKKIDAGMKERLKNAAGCQSILGAVASTVGSIEAMQAVNVLLRKPFVSAPQFIHVSMFDPVPFRIGSL